MSLFTQIRHGEYGIYQNQIYKILAFNSENDNLTLCSTNEYDLQNGFIKNDSECIFDMYGFICTKEVPRKEVTKAYLITTHASYKSHKFDIIGGRNKENMLTICSHYRISHDPVGEELFLRETLISIGFQKGQSDLDGCWYEKEVSIDDPDLELIENSKEIDVGEL